MTVDPVRVPPEWLALRERADGVARSLELVVELRRLLPPGRSIEVHDLGCGSGSMGRWLAPLLPAEQHWVLHDRDPLLLEIATVGAPTCAADGSRVTVESRGTDLARLSPADLGGASLVTASALLDILTVDEVDRIAHACTANRTPALLALTVVGRVELDPGDRHDVMIRDAFNAHQRRSFAGRRLLGPDAVDAAAAAFSRRGAQVRRRSSAWRLGPDDAALTAEWLQGWVAAAVAQDPRLSVTAADYTRQRLEQVAGGLLNVTVHHDDLLAVPA